MKRWFISFLSYFWGRIKHDFGWYPLFDHIVLYKYSNGIPYLSFFFFFFFLKFVFYFCNWWWEKLIEKRKSYNWFQLLKMRKCSYMGQKNVVFISFTTQTSNLILSSWSFCSLSSRFWKILRLHSNHNVIVEARLPKKKIELCWRMPPAGNRAKYLQSP